MFRRVAPLTGASSASKGFARFFAVFFTGFFGAVFFFAAFFFAMRRMLPCRPHHLEARMLRRVLVLACVLAVAAGPAFAQTNRVDTVSPSAPELASYGKYAIGGRTIQATDKNRPDILNTKEGGPTARYDRTLTLEVWYPAALAAGQ